LGIPDGAMQFKAELVMQPMGAAEGMQSEPEMPSEEEVEELMGDMENFNLKEQKEDLLIHLFKERHLKVDICIILLE
jgi:hypothetical protein